MCCVGLDHTHAVHQEGLPKQAQAVQESRAPEKEEGADLQQLLKLYKEEREQLSKDVLYYKQSCKELKRRLKTEVIASLHRDCCMHLSNTLWLADIWDMLYMWLEAQTNTFIYRSLAISKHSSWWNKLIHDLLAMLSAQYILLLSWACAFTA